MKGDVNLKKLIAVIIALILSFNAIFINAFKVGAMMAGPATANALEAFIEAVLAATGAASSSQLDSLDFNQKQTILTDGLNSGSIPQNDFLNYVSDPGLLVAKGLIENSDDLFLVQNVFADAFYDWWYDTFHNKDLSKVLMPTIDLQGYGAVIYSKDSSSKYGHWYYCDYAEIYYDSGGHKCFICYNCKSVSEMTGSVEYPRSLSMPFLDGYAYSLSGDIRMRDTGELASDDEDYVDASPSADTVVGTLDDGTEVTAGDIISGAVDPSKVKPNYDAFTDLGLSDLINKLLEMLSNFSITDSTDLTDQVIEQVGDVALELEGLDGLTVPTSIAHVFPFCLPWDLVNGMYLFNAEPAVPEFTFDITVPSFLNVPEQHWKFDINLKDYESLAIITRWGFMVLFVYKLILLTGQIVKGAGA